MAKTRQEIQANRPTSPHLGIYKIQISSSLSIFHRISGAALFFGLSIISWWFIIWGYSNFNPEILLLTGCCIVKPSLMAISFAWFYHFCNGIRHLVWDTGRCFSIRAIDFTGYATVICAVALTIFLWI